MLTCDAVTNPRQPCLVFTNGKHLLSMSLTWSASTGRSGSGTVFPSRTPVRFHPGFSSSPFWPDPAWPPACVRSPGRAAAGSAQVTSELFLPLHDMIGLVLRKMAASVDRSVGGKGEIEIERERRRRWREEEGALRNQHLPPWTATADRRANLSAAVAAGL